MNFDEADVERRLVAPSRRRASAPSPFLKLAGKTIMYDYIVVGAGAAGCVLTDKLSADGRSKVLLIEAGMRDSSPLIHLPGAIGMVLQSPRYKWDYESAPQKHLDNRRLSMLQGKGIGGSTSINAMIYIRGAAQDYDNWRDLGNVGWGWDDVLPYFVAEENNQRLGPPYHGVSGPLHVTDPIAVNPYSRLFTQAAEEVGVPARDDFNSGDQEGTGLFQFNIHKARRWSAARAYLDPARKRPNVEIRTQRIVSRLIVEQGRAVGVASLDKDGVETIDRAHGEIILSAGVFGSPKLLLLSGIGPANELSALGIDVVHDLPGVGKNYHDHLDIRTVHQALSPWTYDGYDKFVPLVRQGLEYLLFRRGMASSSPCQAAAFVKSRPELERPDISLYFLPAGYVDHGRVKLPGRALTLHNNIMRPRSRGEITLKSSDPREQGVFDPGFLSDPADVEIMIQCVRWARKVMSADILKPHVGVEYYPGPSVQTDDEIEAYVRQNAQIDYHPVGSCKMGPDRMAVVDDRLRVRGVQGLRVADASIMPAVISGNTNAPTQMIGAKAADMILAERALDNRGSGQSAATAKEARRPEAVRATRAA
jgi:choline dehydrogenase-like flavoprotein